MRFLKIISILTFIFLQILPTNAIQPIQSDHTFLLTKINLKNKEHDWITFQVFSPSSTPINLKGTIFTSEKTIKTIQDDFLVNSEDQITLIFKSNEKDSDTEKKLYTSNTGLVGTSATISIQQNGKIFDFFCWTNGNTSEKKQLAFEKLKEGNWHSKNINDCFDSNQIKANQTVQRKNTDTNEKADWIVEKAPKPILKKKPSAAKISTPKRMKNTISKSNTSQGNIQHASNKNIFINEVFPNPKTDDNKNEWIELLNPGNTPVEITGWQLDDSEKGSKPYIFKQKTIIQPQEVFVVFSKESHLSLGNKEDSVRLFNTRNQLVDEVEYENGQEEKSFAFIPFINSMTSEKSSKWEWVKDPTNGKTNPVYTIMQGKVIKSVEFKEKYSFEFETSSQKIYKVTFSEQEVSGPIAKASFKVGNSIQITGIQNNIQAIELKYFEILSTFQNPSDSYLKNAFLIFTGIGLTGSALVYFRKKSKHFSANELNNLEN